MPRDERRVEAQRVLDAEVGELRPDARLVDDAVAEMAAGQRDVRLERRLDELRVRRPPARARRARRRVRARRGRTGPHALRSARAPTGSRSRRSSPSNFVVSAKRSVSHGRLTPWPRTSVATQTSAAPEMKRSISSRRDDERHRAVEHRDLAGMEPVHLSREREHRAAAERDDDRSGRERAERPRADELERELALEDLQLVLGERPLHERERVERTEQEDLAVLACEQEPRPRRAALRVVGPLHLVEDEELARVRRHLDGRADDRRALVDALLAGDETDVLGADPLAEAAMCLLREHPQRARVDARALVRQLAESGVRLARVRRAEVRDDALGLDPARRQRDRDAALGLPYGLRRAPAARAIGAARPLLTAACRTAVAHRLRRGGSGEASSPSRARRSRGRP